MSFRRILVLSEKPDFPSGTDTSWWCHTSSGSCRERLFWDTFQMQLTCFSLRSLFRTRLDPQITLQIWINENPMQCFYKLLKSIFSFTTSDVTADITENLKTFSLLSTNGVIWVQYTPRYRIEHTLQTLNTDFYITGWPSWTSSFKN